MALEHVGVEEDPPEVAEEDLGHFQVRSSLHLVP